MRKPGSLLRCLVCFAIILSGCSQKSDQQQDDIALIQDLYDDYVNSLALHDLDAFMNVWDENGMRAEPGLPTIIGKENIRKRFDQILSAPVEYEIIPIGDPIVEISGDIGYSYRTVTLKGIPRDGSAAIVEDMNVLSIFRKQSDGSWKAYIDCINKHPTWSMDTIPPEIKGDNPYY